MKKYENKRKNKRKSEEKTEAKKQRRKQKRSIEWAWPNAAANGKNLSAKAPSISLNARHSSRGSAHARFIYCDPINVQASGLARKDIAS